MTTKLGDIKRAYEIGRIGRSLWIWHACVDCGKERWVFLLKGKPRCPRCRSCARKRRYGENSPNWKRGWIKDGHGYILVWLSSNDFFYPMADVRGYVKEHRLVMARHLRRCLLPWEVIHHKNGITDDNGLENLQLLPHQRFHLIDTSVKVEIRRLQKQLEEQSRQIKLLKWQLKFRQEVRSD